MFLLKCRKLPSFLEDLPFVFTAVELLNSTVISVLQWNIVIDFPMYLFQLK